MRGGPKYLAIYELEDHNVLCSSGYLDSLKYQPSAARQKTGTSRIGRNFLRNAYRQIFPVHTHPIEQTAGMAPVLQMGRIDVSNVIEEEFNAWYNTVYIPGYMAVPGCMGARRYVAVEGHPKYLTLYEFEHAKVPESEAWTRARASNPWTRRMQPNLRHDEGSPGVYSAFIRNNGGRVTGNLLPPGHENPRRPNPGNFSPGVRKSMPILRPRRLNSIPSLTATSRPARPNSET